MSITEWLDCGVVYKLYESMLRLVKDNENVDQRQNCFLLQTSSGVSRYFSMETKQGLLDVQCAWHRSICTSMTHIQVSAPCSTCIHIVNTLHGNVTQTNAGESNDVERGEIVEREKGKKEGKKEREQVVTIALRSGSPAALGRPMFRKAWFINLLFDINDCETILSELGYMRRIILVLVLRGKYQR